MVLAREIFRRKFGGRAAGKMAAAFLLTAIAEANQFIDTLAAGE